MQGLDVVWGNSLIKLKCDSLWNMIGNTPMIEIVYTFRGKKGKIYAKCENYNLTGSLKDRMALYVLQKAYHEGKIKEGDVIVEATSGNTGISLAAIGRKLGHSVRIIMPDWLSPERKHIIQSLGAEVIAVSVEQGGFIGSIRLAENMAKENPFIFLPRQFSNHYNAEAHEKTTAREIWEQLLRSNTMPDAFIAGVGTGGTVMGVGKFMKAKNKLIKVHPLEPAESPTLTVGKKIGKHRIQGISDEFVPDIVRLNELDAIVQVHDGDAILAAQKLALQLGLAVGISSGANFLGAVQLQQKMGTDACVVTVFPDSNKKYLSTDLMKNEPEKENYLAPDIRLHEYRSINRLTYATIL